MNLARHVLCSNVQVFFFYVEAFHVKYNLFANDRLGKSFLTEI